MGIWRNTYHVLCRQYLIYASRSCTSTSSTAPAPTENFSVGGGGANVHYPPGNSTIHPRFDEYHITFKVKLYCQIEQLPHANMVACLNKAQHNIDTHFCLFQEREGQAYFLVHCYGSLRLTVLGYEPMSTLLSVSHDKPTMTRNNVELPSRITDLFIGCLYSLQFFQAIR